MPDYQARCESALLEGRWDAAEQEALTWASHLPAGMTKDPRPHFARNVVQLIRGQFAEAWKTHAHCLQETDDITQVRVWV